MLTFASKYHESHKAMFLFDDTVIKFELLCTAYIPWQASCTTIMITAASLHHVAIIMNMLKSLQMTKI